MTYLEAWQEGHAAGIACLIKVINESCGTDFETSVDVILYMKQKHSPMVKEESLTQRDKVNNQDLARRIAQQNWLWSDL